MTSSLSVFQLNIWGFNQTIWTELQSILVIQIPDIFSLQEMILQLDNIDYDFKGY